MFERTRDYPTAVASYEDEGVDAAIDWCCDHMEDGDILTVWTSLKSNLRNCPELQQLVDRNPEVEHITGRNDGYVRSRGPVLMAWADLDDLGKIMQNGVARIRALCVITCTEDAIRPWVSAVKPKVLGDGSAWRGNLTPDLDSLVAEAMKSLTMTINHNNTISAGYEKDQVVGTCSHFMTPAFRWTGRRSRAGHSRTAGPVRTLNASRGT